MEQTITLQHDPLYDKPLTPSESFRFDVFHIGADPYTYEVVHSFPKTKRRVLPWLVTGKTS